MNPSINSLSPAVRAHNYNFEDNLPNRIYALSDEKPKPGTGHRDYMEMKRTNINFMRHRGLSSEVHVESRWNWKKKKSKVIEL